MDETVVRLLLAVLVGGLIGAEREVRVGVGLRTMMLICLGAAMFTVFSEVFAVGQGDPRRIAAAVVTGVGFLGAGMILRHQGGVLGLTTAATVWLVAALGMGIGMGQYLMVGVATLLVLVVLWVIPRFQQLTQARKTYTYEVVCPLDENKYDELHGVLKGNGLQVSEGTISKKGEQMTCVWRAYGKPKDHEAAELSLLADRDVYEFRVF
jgi:putative Mg2+ transporter-C (MgtC) family protein